MSSKRHGGPARKDGARYPGGKLKQSFTVDQGHDATLDRRACMVGTARARDARAGYPLGVLLLTDWITQDQHDAGLRYAAEHAIVFGTGSVQSHLASVIDGIKRSAADDNRPASKFVMDTAERYGRKVAAVRNLPIPHNPFPAHVLDRLAIDELFNLTTLELDALLRALAAIQDIR